MTASSGLDRSELVALVASYAVAGISTALVCANFGVGPWVILLAAVVMYSATGELALVAVLSTGGSTSTAIASALLVSARFGVLAAGLSTRLRHVSVLERLAAAFIVVDPPTAVALRQPDDAAARRHYWIVAGWMAVGWIGGSVIGVVAQSRIGNPATWGLDAAIPASLIALLGVAVRTRPGRVTALGAAVVALALTPVLPAGLPVLAALVAVPGGLAAQGGTPPHREVAR